MTSPSRKLLDPDKMTRARRRLHLREIVDSSEQDRHTIGTELRSARLQAGMDLRDVADALRIKYRHLEALESGDLAELPGKTYAVGFVRAYAEHLGLNPSDLTRRFKDEVGLQTSTLPQARASDSSPALSFPETSGETRLPTGMSMIVVLMLVIGGGAWWYMSSSADTTQTAEVPPPPAFVETDPRLLLPDPSVPSAADDARAAAAVETAAARREAEADAREGQASEAVTLADATAPQASENSDNGDVGEGTGVLDVQLRTASSDTRVTETTRDTVDVAALEGEAADGAADPEAEGPGPLIIEDGEAIEIITRTDHVVSAPPVPRGRPVAAFSRDRLETQPRGSEFFGRSDDTVDAPAERRVSAQASPAAQDTAGDNRSAVEGEDVGRRPLQLAVPSEPVVEDETVGPQPENAPERTRREPAVVAATLGPRSLDGNAAVDPGRIQIRALSRSWLRVDDGQGQVLIQRELRQGEIFAVPDQGGLVMAARNAGAFQILVDGAPIGRAGDDGQVLSGLSLNLPDLQANENLN